MDNRWGVGAIVTSSWANCNAFYYVYVALHFFGWSFISAVQYSDFDFHVCFSSKIVHVSQGCGHHLHFLVGHPSVHYFQAQKCLPKMVKTTLAVVPESITGILISKTSFLRLNTWVSSLDIRCLFLSVASREEFMWRELEWLLCCSALC